MHHEVSLPGTGFEVTVILIGLTLLITYFAAYRKHTHWPVYRLLLWGAGVLLAVVSLAGPLAGSAHGDFTLHMVVHLFLGMLAPLLFVLSKPIELILKTLPVLKARKLSAFMKNSRYLHVLHIPATGAILNIGGLFLLYMTGLFNQMHSSLVIFILVHLHVFLAGYLFTHVILEMDFTVRRYSFYHRATVLVLALAGHKILSKMIYATPPEGVSRAAGESGAELMYYGGDLIDVALIVLICYQWYLHRQRKYAIQPEPLNVI
ncbi:cytochrome c oxidase assembly protein [Jeotgalibacillus salarius]|uniref:Cytochrome c oxidase assembly protein n=1 Tax=Jeotgalibacillus salarius TaxID=546023 RepID=A0A4Y8LJA0_9BACL|nr:cytochrome c oxidase assembly protein [Jeotgalibacillus salarius]TFE01781.1 cytochrome c oxidase assembly protein [Jeotgalibacillus salarius]